MVNYISSSKAGKVSLEQLQKCLARIKRLGLGLTEAELIQLANHLPETEVELYLIIENVNERLGEEGQEQLKEVIQDCLRAASS
eukprot:scaffold4505_cov165-Ochromonas_danica.AAC.6